MALKQPNTICKNRNCTRGADGGRKHYYTCRYCTHVVNWRSVACCEECYRAYMDQVAEARNHNVPVDLLPERTDMSAAEVRELVFNTPIEAVVQATKDELFEEMSAAPELSFTEITDRINQELDEEGGA